ncbi:MAG TPA: hypothetical protein PK537_02615 [Candidatus Limiplasma sp.]|nr:hypothetical protein [Candidatus Limiplasma sp.]
MKKHNDDQSYQQEPWDDNDTYEPYNGDGYGDYEDYDDYDDYDDYEDYEDSDLDQELDSEHHFRIAMNVFDLISTLVGLAVILLLTGLLFSLIHWVQRDIAESLSVFTAPFL